MPRFELRRTKPRLGVVALVLVAAGRSRARQLARSLRRVPRADLSGGADLAAGSPRRCAAAQEAARLARLLFIDIIRRDALGPARVIRSPLADLPALDPVALPAPTLTPVPRGRALPWLRTSHDHDPHPASPPPCLPVRSRCSTRCSPRVDESGRPVHLDFADQVGIILAGEPGAGKSVGLANIVAHGALAFTDCRLTLMDGALVELGTWRDCADEFVGPDIDQAIAVIEKPAAGNHRLLPDAARHRPPQDRQGRRRAHAT